MASRLLFPESGKVLVYQRVGTNLRAVAGQTAVVYSDPAGTILADIAVYDTLNPDTPGAVIPTATLTVDTHSRLPFFWGPLDGSDRVYVTVGGGPLVPLAPYYPKNLAVSGKLTILPDDLIDAAQIVTDANMGNHFRVTLGGNRTLANPTNPADGQKIVWEFLQDGAGSRTISLGSKFRLGTDVATVVLSLGAGKRDFMGCIYNATVDLWHVVTFVRGY